MKQYLENETGTGYQIDSMFIPADTGNRYYTKMQKEISEGTGEIISYVPPSPTQEEINTTSKMVGIDFQGIMCSATAEDMWGLSSIQSWVLGGNNVNFHFENGNTLLLTSANFAAFQAVWVPFRASFF